MVGTWMLSDNIEFGFDFVLLLGLPSYLSTAMLMEMRNALRNIAIFA